MNDRPGTGLTIFAGRFGSGKTETAINYALFLARGVRSHVPQPLTSEQRTAIWVSLIDLDIVTPYFRSRETAEALQSLGVEVIAPSVIGQYLDTPAITPQILGTIQQANRHVILDVGGDRQGARALGQFSSAIEQRGYTMHFVVNPFRPFTNTLQGLSDSIGEIEASARLQVSGLVSNPNLIGETTIKQITGGHARIEAFARALHLPIAFVCIEQRWAAELGTNHFAQPVLLLERHFVMAWE
jgi:hypothetical protein